MCLTALVTAFYPWPLSPLLDASETVFHSLVSIIYRLNFSLGISSRILYDLLNMGVYAFCLSFTLSLNLILLLNFILAI